MSHIYIVLLFLIFRTMAYAKNLRTDLIVKEVPNGYYCRPDNRTVQLSHVPGHLCNHYCVSEFQCSMLSYHVNGGVCMVYTDICVEMMEDREQVSSYILLNRPRNHRCISWLPYQGVIPDGERLVRRSDGKQVMARINYNNETLPGKFFIHNLNVKTVSLVNGPVEVIKSSDSAMEFLVVSDTCSVAWVPHVAGNPMPPGAVVGGWTSNSTPLIVAALWTTKTNNMNKKYSYGYYVPESQLGYVSVGGEVTTNTSVDIMVEIWDIGRVNRFLTLCMLNVISVGFSWSTESCCFTQSILWSLIPWRHKRLILQQTCHQQVLQGVFGLPYGEGW